MDKKQEQLLEQRNAELEREIEIEASLERVRTVVMAMQNSADLIITIDVFYKELKTLHIAPKRFGVALIDGETRNAELCMMAPGDSIHTIRTAKLAGHPVLDGLFDAWMGQKEYYPVLKGNEIKEYYQVNRPNAVFPDYPEDAIQYGSVFSFSEGGVWAWTDQPLAEKVLQIYRRFTKVLHLTYKRYKDLKQAEEQARESKIQLGLERVRARAMAMQRSEELAELVDIFFKELNKLDFTLTHCAIAIADANSKGMTLWQANSEVDQPPISFYRKSFDHPYPKAVYDEWQKRTTKWVYNLKGAEKKAMHDYYERSEELMHVPNAVKAGMAAYDSIILSHSFNNFGYLRTDSTDPLSEENLDIVYRFAKVFDLCYTRFTDIKQAEAQTRESQIQLALERVRARTMAMQKSEELAETVYILFQQFKELGQNPDQATIGIINEEERVIAYWVTMYGNQENKVYKFSIDEPDVTRKIYEGWKEHKKSLVIDLGGKALHDFATYRESMGGAMLNKDEKRRIINVAFFSKGLINVQSTEERSEESILLLERFAAVFEGTYTRFLDLKQAEAQVREAQIEAALERVRSKTMAMHNSSDVADTVSVMFDELVKLGVEKVVRCGIGILTRSNTLMEIWTAKAGENEKPELVIGHFDMNIHPMLRDIYDAWDKKETSFSYLLTGDDMARYFEIINSQPGYPIKYDINKLPSTQYQNDFFFAEGILFAFTSEPLSAEISSVFQRFAGVFGQTYRRFLDLQKAEAQARDAQIEAALEKVRSRSLAMHQTDELNEVVSVVFEKLHDLGIVMDQEAASIVIFTEGSKDLILWNAIPDQSYSKSFHIPYYDTAVIKTLFDAKIAGIEFFERNYTPEEKDHFWHWAVKYSGYKNIPDHRKKQILESKHFACSVAFTKNSAMLVSSYNGKLLSEKEGGILKRFARVFEQAYVRFLDLQKAEDQARESQIQLALERVRARTSAMQKSDELAETVSVLFKQLLGLGIPTEQIRTCGIVTFDAKELMGEQWITDLNGNIIPQSFMVPYDEAPAYKRIYKWWKAGKEFEVNHLEGDALREHLGYMVKYTKVPLSVLSEQSFEIYNHVLFFSQGCLFIITRSSMAEYHDVFKRFGAVFRQSYTRFLDLQKAEAAAREAKIEAALERVRSRTLAMQKSDELAETAAVLFRQLIGLGIEPNRLYIGIMREESDEIEFWITDEDGSKVSTMFKADSNQNESMHKMYNAWKTHKKSIVIDMQGKELMDYFHYLGDMLRVPFKGGLTQKRRVQYISFFSSGFIGMASPDDQPQETINLLDRFAYVFNLTYARFNDLKMAEVHAIQAERDLVEIKAARKNAEDALKDLKAAQTKLIQSEKMASLGELTAGIAHEIQNPLNFVNNFSEVSAELIDEMDVELGKGDIEEAKAIASDLKDNLRKIRHHGGRADGIVKGMLQHSRASSNVKEPTDINKLADEYLHLAYHGLRAKDKSFNAELITHLDEQLPKANVVPQDIGRVILNMINNAFYATQQKAKVNGAGYKPAVEVSTSKIDGLVEIRVKDNGDGIPAAIKDKIMQPFFTTKPTGEGTGLGLSLSYDIVVKGHGGTIDVETREGAYTAFKITLPLDK